MKKILSAILGALIAAAAVTSCAVPTDHAVTSSSDKSDDYFRYTARLPKSAVVKVGEDAMEYGFDLSAFDDDGYVLTVKEGLPVVLAKTEAGLDPASRYFQKHLGEGEYTKVYGEGYKVKKMTVAGIPLAEFAIVYPTGLPYGVFDECYEFAANDLAKYLRMATGIEVPVFADSAAGYDHTITLVCDMDAGLKDDGYEINVADGKMTVTGSKRGAMYGCYEFLEKVVGYRFIMYAETYLYGSDLVEVPDGFHERYVPQFIQRSIYSGEGGNYPYAPDMSGAEYSVKRHALNSYAEREAKYGGGGVNETCHGYHNYIDGDNGEKQPCLTDPDNLDSCIANIAAELEIKQKQYPGFENEIERCVRLGHNDNNRFCECKNCRKLWAEEGGYSGLNVRFCNAVADALNGMFDEEIVIEMFAYWGAPEPPKKTAPNEHVSVTYCMYQMCWNHPLGEEWCDRDHIGYDHLTNIRHLEYLREWCRMCDRVIIYWYATGHQSQFSPVSWWDTLRKDMRLMAEAGAVGIMSYSNDGNFLLGDMADYLTLKLAWDPYMSDEEYDAICEEFLRIYLGDAWEHGAHLCDIYQTAKYNTQCLRLSLSGYTNYTWAKDKWDDVMYSIDALIAGATSDAQETRAKKLACLLLFIELSGNYSDRYENGTDEVRADFVRRYRNMYDWLVEYGRVSAGVGFDPAKHPFTLTGDGEWEELY